MGCDIHIVLERRKITGGEWIGVYTTDRLPGRRPAIAQRDYGFFAEVAAVRGSPSDPKNYPRNFPEDVSRLAWQQYMHAPTDYHSVSHMSVAEFTGIYLRVCPDAGRPEFSANDLLGISGDDDQYEHRVVFWFDN